MKLQTLAAAAVLSVAATASFAQSTEPIVVVLAPSGPGMFGTTFERSVSGLFVDTFTFTPSAFAGNVAVNLTSLAGPVNFYAALLNGEGFSFLPESGATSFAFQANVTAATPLELTVLGFAGNADTLTEASGSYRGSITGQTIAAIPEPETYALMLGGLAAIGAMARRRQRKASVA
jgi:hypothetical protein